MKHSSLQALSAPAVLVLLAVPLLFFRLGSYSLVNGDEALYHGVAETMAETGDWLTLRFRGRERLYDTFMNAPLHYWARAGLIQLFGSNLWTARLLSALAGVACALATYGLALRVIGSGLRRPRGAALLAGAVLLTTFQFVYLHSARTGELDTMVSLVFVAVAWSFLRYLETSRGIWLHHACLALLVTLKLPLVIVPLVAELAFFAAAPTGRRRFVRWLWTGALVAPVALSWHIAQALAHPEAFLSVVEGMTAQATGSGSGDLLLSERGNLQFYAFVVIFGAWPWSLAFPVAVPSVLARAAGRPEAWRWGALALFVGALLAFHLAVSKRAPWYAIPCYPFLAIFVGAWLASLWERRPERIEGGAIAVAVALGLWMSVDLASLNPFAVPALNLPMVPRLHSAGPFTPALGIPLTAGLLAIGGSLAMRRVGPRGPLALGGALVAVAVATAGVRVTLPLRFTDYQSPVARLRSDLDALHDAGHRLRRPVDVPIGPLWVLVYTFEPDYEILRVSRPGRAFAFQVRARAEASPSAAQP